MTEKEYIFASFKSRDILELNDILEKCTDKELREKILKEVKIVMSDIELVFTEEEVAAMDAMVMAAEEKTKKHLSSIFCIPYY